MRNFEDIFFKVISYMYRFRKLYLIFTDFLCILFSVLFSILLTSKSLDLNTFISSTYLLTIIGIPIYYLTGQYKGLSRYLGSGELYKIIGRISVIILLYFLVINLSSIPNPSLNFLIFLWMVLSFSTGATKFGLRDILLFFNNDKVEKKNIYIYGAGAAGVQLASAILIERELKILGFIDDDAKLWGRTLKGIKIQSPSILENKNQKIDMILFAIAAISKSKKKSLLKNLQKYGSKIYQIPTVKELTSGEIKIDQLKQVAIEDLIGRDIIIPKKDLLEPDIKNKVVCVTGAGGSIGTELSRQILKLDPQKLILFEMSEVALFKINSELNNSYKKNGQTIIKAVLGNTLNEKLLENTFINNKVDVVFHAAAYKHVPLVQENPLSGLLNNVFSTKLLCNAALKAGIKKLVLISSDKAVRPTNIMGISKRISELIVQAYAEDIFKNSNNSNNTTIFTMVRFGNVLNSSGSVVPLFRKQISNGGPITLTHPKIIRYFMTIPEAAQLVIQAATLAAGGEVFLLDMGDPINIKDLAVQMIKLNGMTVKDKNNPDGDIEIKVTGLRPGEKLYEELLIDGKSIPTEHPLIYKAREKFLSSVELFSKLDNLEKVINDQKTDKAIKLALSLIPENQMEIK